MMYHEKPENLQPLISSVCCLRENNILSKYRVTLIVFY